MKTITLDKVIEEPKSRSHASAKGLLVALLFTAGSFIPTGIDYIEAQYSKARQELLLSMIESDLQGKSLTVDLKTGKGGMANSLSREELIKAIYVFQVRESQHEFTLETIKDAIK